MSAFDCIVAVQSTQQSEIHHNYRDEIHVFILSRIPSYILCSNSLKTASVSSARREKEDALTKQWTSFNCRDYFNAMTFDCDHDEWPHFLKRLREQGIPDPTLIVRSALTGTAHITWWWKKGKRKACRRLMRIYEGIYERIRAELCADTQFKQYLCKNPLHDAYEVVSFTGQEYEFSDFLQPLIEFAGPDDYILSPRWEGQFEGAAPSFNGVKLSATHIYGEKGSKVWETGRQRVYRYRSADYSVIHRIYAEVAAELGSPIKPRALQGMARRTAAWMLAHPNMLGNPARDMRDIDAGVMRREAKERGQLREWNKLHITSKRMLAAERTNAHRTQTVRERLIEAVNKIWDRHRPITQISLAQESNISLPTVKRLWKMVLDSESKGITRSNPFSPFSGAGLEGNPVGLDGSTPITLKEISALSKARAKRYQQEQDLIFQYTQQAKRMAKRGAVVEDVPPRGQNASPELKQAHEAALAARRDCQRRADARTARAEQKSKAQQRKIQFRAWADAGDIGSYKAFLGEAKAYWNALLERVSGDSESREQMRIRRGAAFKRYKREWDSVLLEVERHDRRTGVLRTEKDRLDHIADSTPLSHEQQTVRRIIARVQARQDAMYGIVDSSIGEIVLL